MTVHNSTADRQTEPDAAHAGFAPEELFKNVGFFARYKTCAIVLHRNNNIVAVSCGSDLDGSAHGGVLQGIIKDVYQNLLDENVVHTDPGKVFGDMCGHHLVPQRLFQN